MPTRGILVKANFALLNERVEKLIHQKRPFRSGQSSASRRMNQKKGAVRPSSKNKVRTICVSRTGPEISCPDGVAEIAAPATSTCAVSYISG